MVHWLPHTLVRCCDFAELQQSLAQENGCAQDLLHRFLTLCASILELVRAAGGGGGGGAGSLSLCSSGLAFLQASASHRGYILPLRKTALFPALPSFVTVEWCPTCTAGWCLGGGREGGKGLQLPADQRSQDWAWL